jgi:hypothetical protein
MDMTENVQPRSTRGVSISWLTRLLDRGDADQAQLLGPDGLLTQLTQRVLNRALDVELVERPGYEQGEHFAHSPNPLDLSPGAPRAWLRRTRPGCQPDPPG